MGAGFGIDALVGETEPLDRTTVDKVLLDDLRGILRLHVAIPDRFGVHDDGGAVLALIEAAGFVNANRAAQAGGFRQLLELGVQFTFAVAGARGPGSAFRAGVVADEDVVLENGQT